MRWGIFWRKLLFDVMDIGNVITSAVLLHNFLVDRREMDVALNVEDANYFRTFSLREEQDVVRAASSTEAPSAVATDNNDAHPGGRPIFNQQLLGKRRDRITLNLYGSGRG
jgi:hypothetical protein